jgi:hypothetical protein
MSYNNITMHGAKKNVNFSGLKKFDTLGSSDQNMSPCQLYFFAILDSVIPHLFLGFNNDRRIHKTVVLVILT